MDRFTFILQLLLTFRGQAGTSDLINIPLNESSKSESHSLLQVSLAPQDRAELLAPTIHLSIESYSSIPDLSFLSLRCFKVMLMVPAPRACQTCEELGQQLGIVEAWAHFLQTLRHSCLPRLAEKLP